MRWCGRAGAARLRPIPIMLLSPRLVIPDEIQTLPDLILEMLDLNRGSLMSPAPASFSRPKAVGDHTRRIEVQQQRL